MVRQVTLSSVEIRHIMINEIKEFDEVGNAVAQTGFNCTVGYAIKDADGNVIMNPESQKYTSGTSFPDSEKLSGDSEKLITDFVNAMSVAMNGREKL
jgi:hypothetical protein